MHNSTLEEAIWEVCNYLNRERQLITKSSVTKELKEIGEWSDDVLDKDVPKFVNAWRLSKLSMGDGIDMQGGCLVAKTTIGERLPERIASLEAELDSYKNEMEIAKHTIASLKSELFEVRSFIKIQKDSFANELRSLLAK